MSNPANINNRTQRILGNPSNWVEARLELVDTQPLHGGRRMLVYGNGQVVVQQVQPGLQERRYEYRIERKQVLNLLQLCVNNDLAAIDTGDRLGLPNETRIQLRLTGSQGAECRIFKWAGVQDANFDSIYQAILEFEREIEGIIPSYEGHYQDYYYPRNRVKELREGVRDWYKQIDIDPVRVLSIVIPMTLLFVIAYFWVRIDPRLTYGFGGGVAHGYVVLHNWIISWFDGREVWAPNNTGTLYVLGFVVGVLLPLLIDSLFRIIIRSRSEV